MAGPREAGIRLIVGYKLAKAAAWLALAAILLTLAARGRLEHVRLLAAALRAHVASRWSLALADALVALLSVKGLRLVETGLLLDGVLSAVEGWALLHGHRWGPWLVVVASALPLPIEIWEALQRASAPRLALVAVNAAVVAYLLRWLRRHPRPQAP